MPFKSLHLGEPILKALKEEGYTTPTPIQAAAIPIILKGKDLLGVAQTGTGKTAAFALPIIQILSDLDDLAAEKDSAELHAMVSVKPRGAHHTPRKRKPIRSLILTPTRELAVQIDDSFKAYGRHVRLSSVVIFGGVGQKPQTSALQRGVDIVIATPGRLLDLIQQGFVDLRKVEIFVLDEADRMLDMGFVRDVEKIIKELPTDRQSLFFSATMPPPIVKLSHEILYQPERVEVTPAASTVDLINQSLYYVEKANKNALLMSLIDTEDIQSALVFTRTKHGADAVVKVLNRNNISAEAIHGNKAQNARQRALNNFKAGKTQILVATDIAARGIDIDDLAHVINYEIPNVPETYVHRIGRTGRAGASGSALSFSTSEEKEFVRDIEKLIKKRIPVVHEHPFAKVARTQEPPTLKSSTAHKSHASNANGHARPKAEAHARGESNSKGGSNSRGGSDSRRGSNSRGGSDDRRSSHQRGEESRREDSRSRNSAHPRASDRKSVSGRPSSQSQAHTRASGEGRSHARSDRAVQHDRTSARDDRDNTRPHAHAGTGAERSKAHSSSRIHTRETESEPKRSKAPWHRRRR